MTWLEILLKRGTRDSISKRTVEVVNWKWWSKLFIIMRKQVWPEVLMTIETDSPHSPATLINILEFTSVLINVLGNLNFSY